MLFLAAVSSVDLSTLIVDVWRDILNDPSISPNDDFFAAGGHSLLAVQASQRIGDAIGKDVPVVLVFMHPTPIELANAVGGLEGS